MRPDTRHTSALHTRAPPTWNRAVQRQAQAAGRPAVMHFMRACPGPSRESGRLTQRRLHCNPDAGDCPCSSEYCLNSQPDLTPEPASDMEDNNYTSTDWCSYTTVRMATNEPSSVQLELKTRTRAITPSGYLMPCPASHHPLQ